MDHVCKSALTKELQEKSNGSVLKQGTTDYKDGEFATQDSCFLCACAATLLQEQWEALVVKLSQTRQQIQACESAMVFAFVEVNIKKKNLKKLPRGQLFWFFVKNI